MTRGRAGTMTHDYLRHGTTTLFAALNVLDGMVNDQCMARHRTRNSSAPQPDRGRRARRKAGARHTRQLGRPQASQRARLAGPAPGLDISFTPPLLFLAKRSRDLLRVAYPPALPARRFHSLVDLQGPISRYLIEHNSNPSSGQPIPTASSRRSTDGIKCSRQAITKH
jgi:hypothetical protein